MDIPVLELPTVFHLGTLQKEHRGSLHSTSLEGAGLSVSLCPEAWQRIAKLGGAPLQQLDCPGAVFLDLHSMDAEMKEAIAEWAEAAGLAKRESRWVAWRFDDESEEWGFMACVSRDDAIAEVEDNLDTEPGAVPDLDMPEEDGGPPGGSWVSEEPMLLLTEAGSQRAMGCRQTEDASDIAAMFYAEDVLHPSLPELVGVWWRENYDPSALSAPRGAILPSSLDAFAAVHADMRSILDDEELLDSMPDPELRAITLASAPPGLS